MKDAENHEPQSLAENRHRSPPLADLPEPENPDRPPEPGLTFRKRPAESDRMKSFLKNLELLLAARGWSKQQLADKAGMTRSMVSRLMTSDRTANIETLERVAAACGKTLSEMFRESQKSTPPQKTLAKNTKSTKPKNS